MEVATTNEKDPSSILTPIGNSEPSLLVPMFVSSPNKAESVGEPTGVDYALWVNENGVLVPKTASKDDWGPNNWGETWM